MSFTASAGQDFQSGISAALPNATAPLLIGSLVPPSGVRLGVSVALPRLDLDRLVREARLRFDLPDETEELLASLPPRADLKAGVAGYPAVDRARKGDPIVNLRPTLSRRGTDLRRSGNAGASRMLFGANEHDLASPFIAGGADSLDLSAEPGFTPWQGPDPTTTRQATSIQSPAAAAGGATASSRGAVTPSAGGATPAVPRAVALSSTTPAPAGRDPDRDRGRAGLVPGRRHEPPPRPRRARNVGRRPRPRRAAELRRPDRARKIARSAASPRPSISRRAASPRTGQAAVAQVVLNRVKSGLYPTSICGVVYQNRHRHLACQFTFACEGKSLRITEPEPWETADAHRERGHSRARPTWPRSAARPITMRTTSGRTGRAA